MILTTKQQTQIAQAAGYDSLWYLPATGEVFIDFRHHDGRRGSIAVDRTGSASVCRPFGAVVGTAKK